MAKKQADYIEYAENVVSGKIPACVFVVQACKRFFDDLKRSDITFDYDEADRAIGVISKFKHTKGERWKGKNFVPTPWQAFIIANIFGFYKDGRRRFTKSYLEMPKKNGKSPLAAAIAGFVFIDSKGSNPEIYSIATELPQAAISWEYAATMLETLDEEWGGILDISVKRGENNRRILMQAGSDGIFAPLSFGDNERHDGKNPTMGIIDEYHAHKNNRGYKILADGTGMRANPHIMAITTAGFDRQSACYKLREHCTRVLSGVIKDDAMFSMIYTIDVGDDWKDPKTWAKANPNFEISVSRQSFEDDIPSAMSDGSSEVSFRTKKLNEWMDSVTSWVPDVTFEKGNTGFKPPIGLPHWGALDLARTGDFTAYTKLWVIDGRYKFTTNYFMPETTVRQWSGEIGENIRQWAREGWIHLTPGESTDYAYIEDLLIKDWNEGDVISIEYDVANAKDLATRLYNSHEMNLRVFPQTIKEMSLPTKRLQEIMKSGLFEYDGNPVTRWMMGNVNIFTDNNDNQRIVKNVKRTLDRNKKVDGPISMVMALGAQMDENNQTREKEWVETWSF